jgi:hypothetical protein
MNEERTPIFEIIDLEAELRDKTINISKADELSNTELSGNYFDLIVRRPDGIRFRYRNEIGMILSDGTIRLVAKDEGPEKAINTFKTLINIAKKMTKFDEEKELFNLDLVLILLFESKREAINVILNFIGKEKIELFSKILGEPVSAPYIGIYLREFGKPDWREYMDFDIEPSREDLTKYWVKIRYNIQKEKGINKLPNYISEMISKVSSIINMLEGEK